MCLELQIQDGYQQHIELIPLELPEITSTRHKQSIRQ